MCVQEKEVSRGLEELGSIVKIFTNGNGFIRRKHFPRSRNDAFFTSSDAVEGLKFGDEVIFRLSQIAKKDRERKGSIAVLVRKIM